MIRGTRVTAVSVLHNNSPLIPELAETLSGLDVRAVIYDSASADGSSVEAASRIPGATVISGENRGFGHGNNQALRSVDTEYVLLLNSDARIAPGSLSILEAYLDAHPSVAAAQPLVRAWRWPLVTAGSGVYVNPFGEAWDARFMHLEQDPEPGETIVPAVTAAVSLWRTDALRSLGGFDTGYFMYFEDADMCLRAAAAGWGFVVLRHASALHLVGASSNRGQASLWELASSIRLARRFLGGGRLPRGYLSREIRIELSLFARGLPWLPRLGTIIGSLRSEVEPVTLPRRVLAMLHGSPSDEPFPRPGPRGPGFQGDYLAPFGVFGSTGARVLLRSPFGPVTGGMCDDEGATRARFSMATGESAMVSLLTDGGLSYIFCDDPKARLEVTSDDQSGEG